jgi:hypothetical protein
MAQVTQTGSTTPSVTTRLQVCGGLVALHGIVRVLTFAPLVILLLREPVAEAVHYIAVGAPFAFSLALSFVGIGMLAGKVFAPKINQLLIFLAATAELFGAMVLLIGIPSEAFLLLLFGPSPMLLAGEAFVVYSLTRHGMMPIA